MGVSSAKAIAATRRLPLVPVDHLHGHVVASTLGDDPVEAPYLCLVASGGHTFLARVDEPARYEVLGQTLDDAAGEAFDKACTAARPRLSGRAGGRPPGALGRSRGLRLPAQRTRRARLQLQRAEDRALYAIRDLGEAALGALRGPGRLLPAGDRRRAVSTRTALERSGIERLAIGGGVAANSSCAAVAGLGVPGLVPPVSSARTTRR